MKATGAVSQADVAKALGISRTRVIQLERSAVAKICRALDLDSPYETRTMPSGRTKRAKR